MVQPENPTQKANKLDPTNGMAKPSLKIRVCPWISIPIFWAIWLELSGPLEGLLEQYQKIAEGLENRLHFQI